MAKTAEQRNPMNIVRGNGPDFVLEDTALCLDRADRHGLILVNILAFGYPSSYVLEREDFHR
jgi:hypothetical protein